jgi:hypothetical protein
VDENLETIQQQFTDVTRQAQDLSLQVDDNVKNLNQIQQDILSIQTEANKQADILTDIQDTIEQTQAGINILSNIDTRILTINPDTLVFVNEEGVLQNSKIETDEQGNEIEVINDVKTLTLNGLMNVDILKADSIETNKMNVDILKADSIETNKLTISNTDDQIVGVAIVCPVGESVIDGKCEKTENSISDGKSVQIKSNVITENTVIFTSFENNPGTSSWVEKTKDEDGNWDGFSINLNEVVENLVKINWWIVEKK